MGEQIDAKDGGQSLKHSYEVLRQAAASLKEIIERKFDEAVDADDVASMERYFKLFPLINEHGSGLQRFGKYLCSKIEKIGDDNFKVSDCIPCSSGSGHFRSCKRVGLMTSEGTFFTRTR